MTPQWLIGLHWTVAKFLRTFFYSPRRCSATGQASNTDGERFFYLGFWGYSQLSPSPMITWPIMPYPKWKSNTAHHRRTQISTTIMIGRICRIPLKDSFRFSKINISSPGTLSHWRSTRSFISKYRLGKAHNRFEPFAELDLDDRKGLL